MGATSMLEDETERRDGEPPRYAPKRPAPLYDLIPKDVIGFMLSNEQSMQLDRHAHAIQQLARESVKLEAGPPNAKRIGKMFKVMKKQQGHALEIAKVLAPLVLRMHAGPRKRQMQRMVGKLRAHYGI